MVHQQSIEPFSLQKWSFDLDHFPNWKMPVRQRSQTTFHGKKLLILDHFSNWKMIINQSIIHQFSLPTWESSLPFSIKKSSPRAPAWVRKLFHLGQKLYQNVCLSAHLLRYILENHFLLSGLHHGECNAWSQMYFSLSGTLVFSEGFI